MCSDWLLSLANVSAGGSNDQIIDVISLDEFGKEVANSAAQMKFVGKNASEMLDRLRGSRFNKYLEANVKLSVPDDFFDELIGKNGENGLIDQKIIELEEQLRTSTEKGKLEAAEKIKKQIDDCKTIKRNLTKSGLTNDEAIYAREHPELSAAKDIGKNAVKAGVQQAAIGAAISGSISLIRNA